MSTSQPEAINTFQARVNEIDARIALLESSKASMISTLTTGIPATLMSPRFSDDLGRPFDIEILWLRREREKAAVEFAETFLTS